MARLGIIFNLHGYAQARNFAVSKSIPTPLVLIPEERRKTFGLSWNRTQVVLLHIYKQPH